MSDRDAGDVRIFATNPEFKLSNEVQAVEQFELEQEALDEVPTTTDGENPVLRNEH